MAQESSLGRLANGEDVRCVAISAGGLTATVMSYGSILQDLRLEGHAPPLVLGFDSLAEYIDNPYYFGANVGRNANRLGKGRFTLAGRAHTVEPDHPERNGLHGGSLGFGRRNWSITGYGSDFVAMAISEADMAMGYPGAIDVQCTYRVKPDGILSIEFSATADEPTLCNLAHHSYFNLDNGGAGDILGHRMQINASAYTPVDAELIPTGDVLTVSGTRFDFSTARSIGWGEQREGYDINFCLGSARGALHRAVWAKGAQSGIEMETWTTEPGVQLYTGIYMPVGVRGLGGLLYGPSSGFCLEPQVWPDAPNHAHFPQSVLRPGEIYRQTTEYRFRRV